MKKFFELINRNLNIARLSQFIQKDSGKKAPLITISREMGSGGRPIAYLVAKKLRRPWRVYHEQIVDEIAKQTNLEKELVREIDEKNLPLVEELVADFFGKRYLNLGSYYKQLVKILSTIGQRGKAVIVGRGANFLFPQALKVRIICEMEQRIKWEMEYEKLSNKQAVVRIEKSDQERDEFIKAVFGHDQRKAHHYDIIIRTGSYVSLEDASDLIVKLAKRRFRLF